MKIKTKREAILRPIQQVSGVVEKRQTLPILSNILIKAENGQVTMTGTDLEVELISRAEIPVDEGGEITLPAKKIMDICRSLPDEVDVDLTIQGDKATLQAGKSRFTLATLPAPDFPTLDDIATTLEFSVSQGTLRRLIDKTHFAMAQQDVRYYLNGLMLEIANGELRTVATDGHRLAMCRVNNDVAISEAKQIIIPRKGVMELLRLLDDSEDAVTVQVGSNHIKVNMGQITFTSKLIDGRFPDYERVIPANANRVVTADRELVRQALVRTSILSNEKYRGIRFQLDTNTLKTMAHNPEQEEAEEEISVEYDGEAMEIGFNSNYIQDANNAIETDKIRLLLTDPNSSCLIKEQESDDCSYVVMPMRL